MKPALLAAALLGTFCLGVGQALAAPRYTVIPLQSLPGAETEDTAHCELRVLNSKGESAGSAGARLKFHAAWWDAQGIIHPLGKQSDHLSEAEGINNSGQIIAYAASETLAAKLYRIDALGLHLLTPPAGTKTLGFIGGEGINNAGQAAFNVQTGTGFPFRAILSDHGTLTDLGHLPLPQGEAAVSYTRVHALNNLGAAVGESAAYAQTPPTHSYHAFLWQKNVMTDLGVLPGCDRSSGTAVNDHGDVIGTTQTLAETQSDAVPFFQGRGFLWRQGVMTDLGALPGCRYTEPTGINNRGQIVGSSYNIQKNAGGSYSQTGGVLNSGVFLWQNGKMQDLQALVPAGWQVQSVVAINDRGDILCTGYHAGMPSRTLGSGAFLLRPL